MVRLFDGLLEWLMRPTVRRIRRWSFVVTLPIAVLVATVFGVQQGALVIALRLGLWLAVLIAAWRVGGERGEALRDLLMHPRGRALTRAELDIVTALPRLLVAHIARREQAAGTTYHRATFGVALGCAFTPVVLSETVALHLLLHGGLVAWVSTALHAYSLVWLWGFVLGPRAFPHRIGPRTAVLRNGALYRVKVPLDAIVSATARTERVSERCLVERDGAVLLAARGRVDVWLQLSEPVRVQRPLDEPLLARRLAIASDEPELLVARLRAGAVEVPAGATRRARRGLIGALDAAGVVRDAAQPA